MVASNGQVLMQAPALYKPPVQDLQGSALEAASTKTIASNAALAATSKAMGAGQKGSSRRRKYRGGAENMNAHAVNLPEAGTIKGVSAMQNHLTNVNNLNQIRASAIYDKLGNAQPYDPTPAKGGKRTKRKHTQKHGRRNNRTHRRRNRKSSSRSRRSRRSLL
jgi:hypothetical protein